jgi:hypothetical protein
MATTADMITRAMRLANIVGEGQTATPEQMSDALDTLNEMIDSWNLDSLMLYQTTNDQVTTVANQATYTVGAGGQWNVDRPVQINSSYITFQGVSYPLDEVNQDEYNKITIKAMAQPLPRFFLYLNTFPLGTLTLWPAPTQALPVTLSVDRIIASLALGETLSLATGYAKAIRANLAVELCPEYGREPPPSLVEAARESKADIKRANHVPAFASFDPTLTSSPGGYAAFLAW